MNIDPCNVVCGFHTVLLARNGERTPKLTCTVTCCRNPVGRGAHLLVQNPCVRIKHIYGLNSSSATQILFRSKPGTCYHRGRNTIFISTGGRSAHANTSGSGAPVLLVAASV